MRDLAEDIETILAVVRRRGIILLLDFDGTISPIVPDFTRAQISPRARMAIRSIVRRWPVAVISGRALPDVIRRVGIHGITYVGCHGLQVSFGGQRVTQYVSSRDLRAFAEVCSELRTLAYVYPDLIFEDKKLSFALHYTRVPREQRESFRANATMIVSRAANRRKVKVIDSHETFDVVPRSPRHKGTVARLLARVLALRGRQPVTVFIGDALTDEDVFMTFKTALTVRVGYGAGSAAKYFVRTREDVDTFLERIAQL